MLLFLVTETLIYKFHDYADKQPKSKGPNSKQIRHEETGLVRKIKESAFTTAPSICRVNFIYYVLKDGTVDNYTITSERRKLWVKNFVSDVSRSSKFSGSLHYPGNLAMMVLMLQEFEKTYPRGGTAKDYSTFERLLKRRWEFSREAPSIVNLIEYGLFSFSQDHVFVNPDVLKCKMIFIEKNYCSNLYRFLKNCHRDKVDIKILMEHMAKKSPGCQKLSPENVLYALNSYPMVFDLEMSSASNCFLSAAIRLRDEVCRDLEWLIVLDR